MSRRGSNPNDILFFGDADTETILQIHVRLDGRVPGHGVGLAVVNDLVASHHGELKLARADLGGARVDIVLPSALRVTPA